MRILQVISSSATSGAERHVFHLSQQLAARGHHVEVVCPGNGWLPDILSDAGIPVHTHVMKGRGWLETLGEIIRIRRKQNIDVVHTHLTRAAYIGYAANLVGRMPIVTSVHIANNDQIYKRLARKRNRLVAVSSFVSGMLRGRGIPGSYIDTVYNGTDFGDFAVHDPSEVKEEFAIPNDRRVVGLVGRVCREKGHLEMVTALKSIRKEHPDAHVMFVGRVEESFVPVLDEAIEAAGVRENLTFAGIRHDVPRLLDSFTLSAMPSHIETFGIAAIEAMARGKAVVASRVGGLPEVVRHRQTGLLIDLRPEALAEAVSYLLSNEDERELMGQRGRKAVEEKFTLDEMARQFERVYAHASGAKIDPIGKGDREADLIKT